MMNSPPERLPARIDEMPVSLVDLAETLGMRVALAMMQHFGGQDIRPPKNPGDDHPIIKALGPADGRAVCHFLSGMRLYVPHGRVRSKRQQVLDLEADGKGRAEIARILGISHRHVRRVANTSPKRDSRQLGFDLD
jgi:Mor family transcriptional regulator